MHALNLSVNSMIIPRMQLLIDFFPLLVFLAAYFYAGIYVAAGAIMAAMTLQIAIQWFRHRTVSKMLLISGALVIVLGGVTLFLRNPLFFQWKPTILNGLFALAFLGSRFMGKMTLTERVMGHAIQLSPEIWRELNMMWVGTFAFLAAANLYVLYHFDEATWAIFKVAGSLGITFAMVIVQAIWIAVKTNGEEQRESAE